MVITGGWFAGCCGAGAGAAGAGTVCVTVTGAWDGIGAGDGAGGGVLDEVGGGGKYEVGRGGSCPAGGFIWLSSSSLAQPASLHPVRVANSKSVVAPVTSHGRR